MFFYFTLIWHNMYLTFSSSGVMTPSPIIHHFHKDNYDHITQLIFPNGLFPIIGYTLDAYKKVKFPITLKQSFTSNSHQLKAIHIYLLKVILNIILWTCQDDFDIFYHYPSVVFINPV